MYPLELVAPMAKDLTLNGFEELKTPEEVDAAFSKTGTMLCVVNSVCGCAAGMARPGAKKAAQFENRPDHLVTVFAGVDQAATAKAREYMLPYPPSSPSMALFKDGKLVYMIERHQIEGNSAEAIAQKLNNAFEQYC